jgi:glycosyltransferase involved in cell wall biosynthesis
VPPAHTLATLAAPPRVGVLVVAYNAATTLAETLNRLPESFCATVDHVLVCDDASSDGTYHVGLEYQTVSALPLTVVRHPENLGYGGNQKAGYRWAVEHGLDVVVLLHGDGQYAPEVIEEIVAPLLTGRTDAVFGSRMMDKGSARKGGMPAYKYVGNKILTRFQNSMTGLGLTEWHSGYRAYRVDALEDIDFESYTDDFDFDTEIILGLHAAGKAIVEVPIPTYYGDEICYVNGLKYAKDVTIDVFRYRARKLGFGQGSTGLDTVAYDLKPSEHSSHGRLLGWLRTIAPTKVLDVGCSDGRFGALARALGHEVIGVDLVKHEGVAGNLDGFVEADLNRGLPEQVGTGYGAIVAGDVLEHVTDPARLLNDLADRLAPGGSVLISVPNFAHWYPRARVVTGKFDYDKRGILDQGHVRFFTRKSFERLIAECNLDLVERGTVGSPFELIGAGDPDSKAAKVAAKVSKADRAATRMWPTMFGYQFLYKVQKPR